MSTDSDQIRDSIILEAKDYIRADYDAKRIGFDRYINSIIRLIEARQLTNVATELSEIRSEIEQIRILLGYITPSDEDDAEAE